MVEGATRITVTTVDGTEYEATLLGTDSKTDVAVLVGGRGRGRAAVAALVAAGRLLENAVVPLEEFLAALVPLVAAPSSPAGGLLSAAAVVTVAAFFFWAKRDQFHYIA